MKYLFYIFLLFLASNCRGQDSTQNKSLIFIDSLKTKSLLKIKCFASNCFHHENYTILIWKTADKYFSKLFIKKSTKVSQPVFIKRTARLNLSQIDSIRKFEYYLSIYPTEGTDGQTYYSYELSMDKKQKTIFDGAQYDPWMRVEWLIKILFPLLKQD